MVDVNVREQIRLKDLSVLRFFNKLLGLEVKSACSMQI
jgi:hypothetical protein